MAGGLVQIPVSINRALGLPIQDQLANGIRGLIMQGAIRAGMRLPATRALSRQLKVSRNTVKIAYSNLASQGYLHSKATSGTFVSTKLPDIALQASAQAQPRGMTASRGLRQRTLDLPPKAHNPNNSNVFDFGLRTLDATIAPDRTWRRLLLNHLPYRARQTSSMDPMGLDVLRQAIANYVSPLRGMSIDPSNSFIVTNDYRAFDIVNNALLKPGSGVAIEDPCDAGLLYLLRKCGVQLHPIPVDDDGMIVGKLPSDAIELVYVSPTHQRPTGSTMSRDRRQQLLAWAAGNGAHIVEWDTFGEFCYDDSPVPSLFSMDDQDRVIYINSFSSWIGADLQLGYVVAPYGLSARMGPIREFVDLGPAWLDQRVAADFISSDSFFGHLRRVRQAFKQRRDAVVSAISEHMGSQFISGQNAGRHLIWHLPADFPSSLELQSLAAPHGVAVQTLFDGFCQIDPSDCRHDPNRLLLLGYSALSEERAAEGILRLAEIWGHRNYTLHPTKWSPPLPSPL